MVGEGEKGERGRVRVWGKRVGLGFVGEGVGLGFLGEG